MLSAVPTPDVLASAEPKPTVLPSDLLQEPSCEPHHVGFIRQK
jgi:hypothetical protein